MSNHQPPDRFASLPGHASVVEAGGIAAVQLRQPGSTGVDPTTAAFFDIDNTVIRGASIYHLARGLRALDILSKGDMFGFAVKQAKFLLANTENLEDMAKVTEAALGIVKGRNISEMRSIANGVFDDYMAEKLWPGTLAVAQSHLNQGQRVWLVSATPVEVAEVIAERLGLSGALGTRAEIDAEGFYTGHLVGLPMHGRAKAEAVRMLAEAEGLDLQRCYAYSDSANDIPMLSLVGNPCAINPDHTLREHARREGWQIRNYRPRRLGLKLGLPLATAAAFGIGVGVGAAAVRRSTRPRQL